MTHPAIAAYHAHKEAAHVAATLAGSWMTNMPRLPGCDTAVRCAVRLDAGHTVEEAAAREYLYRWHLPLDQWLNHSEAKARSMPVTGAWPVPHAIGL